MGWTLGGKRRYIERLPAILTIFVNGLCAGVPFGYTMFSL